jgi:hypothetical protein
VPESPFEGIARELKRAMEEHAKLFREEMERVREQMHGAMEQMKEEMERAGGELHRAMEGLRSNAPDMPGWIVEPAKPGRSRASSKRKRPRRKPPGGEAAPVKPRPKPMPLKDGAEAPVD